MLYVDVKYANLLSSQLNRFKVISRNPFRANFRCPLCGDSKKNQFKARGYFLERNDVVVFKCHNCQEKHHISDIIRKVNPVLYKEYALENYSNKFKNKELVDDNKFKIKPSIQLRNEPLLGLKKISALKWDHPAKLYVTSRMIPNEFHGKLFYCSKFAKWVNSMIPNKLKEENDTPRLIIPFLDSSGVMFGFSGRSFDPKAKSRYISIMLTDEANKVYGLDMLDNTTKYYVTEGQIDSMFLPNAIAMAGADLQYSMLNENAVFVYDNEPRNKEIVNRIEKTIEKGYSIYIWPADLIYKDINDMILAGYTKEKVKRLIDNNTYSGLSAKMKVAQWKKT
jgi:hypothetical protein